MTRLVPREQVVEALEAQMRESDRGLLHIYGVDFERMVTLFEKSTGRTPESSSFADLSHWVDTFKADTCKVLSVDISDAAAEIFMHGPYTLPYLFLSPLVSYFLSRLLWMWVRCQASALY